MRAKINAIAASTWRVCFIAVALVAVVSCSSYGKNAITSVNVVKQADRTVICVQGNCPLSMVSINSTRGAYVAFQFPFALEAKGRLVGVHNGGIANVRYGNFSARPPATRIVVNCFGTPKCDATWAADKSRVDITVWKHGCKPAASLAPVPVAKPVVPKATIPVVKPVVPQATIPVVKPAAPKATVSVMKPAVFRASIPVAKPSVSSTPRSVRIVLPAPPAPTPAAQAAPAPIKDVAAPLVRLSAASKSLCGKLVAFGAQSAAAYRAALEPPVVTRVMGMVETQNRPAPPNVARVAVAPRIASIQPILAKAPAVVTAPDPKKNISLNFIGADINDVLKALAVQSGQNIVAGKDVKGEVTVSLSNVSLDEAMDYVAKLSGYTYVKSEGTYLVASKESINGMTGEAGPSTETRVFALHYAKADDVVAILDKVFPGLKISNGKGDKSGSDQSNANQTKLVDFLVVSAPSDQMKSIDKLISQMEDSVKTSMANLVTEIYVVKYCSPSMIADSVSKLVPGVLVGPVPSPGYSAANFAASGSGSAMSSGSGSSESSGSSSSGSSGSSSSGASSSGGGTSANNNRLTEALTITGPAEQVKRALDLADRLDTKSPMINIEAKVTSIDKSGEEELGLTWNWSDITFSEGFTDFLKTTNTNGAAGENLHNVKRSHGLFARQPFNFGATLDALITNGNAKVLASPNLLCLEGVPGTFFVGDEVTYIQRIEVTATGQNITTDTKSVGVLLRVVSDVNPDGFITLNLHPEVSTLKLTTSQGMTLPTVSRRYTDHIVRVKNGDTIAIGGLIRSDELVDMSKVPLLGDLPFLGKLFQHKSKTTSENEVVMFITAKVVND